MAAAIGALTAPAGATSGSSWRFWDSTDGFVESYTSNIAISPSGSVWTKHGVPGNIELLDGYSAPHYQDPGASGVLECAPDGTLWMWSGNGLKRFENGRWASFPVAAVTNAGTLRRNSREAWDFTTPGSHIEVTVGVVALDRMHALILIPERILEFDAAKGNAREAVSISDAGLNHFTSMRRAIDGTIYVTGAAGVGRLDGSAGNPWRWRSLPNAPADYIDFQGADFRSSG